MKSLSTTVSAFFLAATVTAPAASLLLDFGPTAITAGSETVSPGHDAGVVPSSETTWNQITSGATTGGLSFGDATSASGVSITMGQESSADSGIINLNGTVGGSIPGNGGGVAGQQSLFGEDFIYGDGSTSTAAQDSLFNNNSDSAAGLTIDGLAPGIYEIFVMGRNTNSNGGTPSMDVFAASGTPGATFDFNGLTPQAFSNTAYSSADYDGEYETFIDGENFSRATVTVGTGESLFLAIDGTGSETRGFLNSVSVTQIPEPSSLLLGLLGLFPLARRRR